MMLEGSSAGHSQLTHVDAASATELAKLLAEMLGMDTPVSGVPFVYPMRFAAEAAETLPWRDDAVADRLLLHESQAIRSVRPLSAGEALSIRFDARRSEAGADLSLTASDPAGDLAVELTTRLCLGSPALLLGARANGKAARSEAASVLSRQFTAEMVGRYAAVSGDRNPLHMDLSLMRAHGFPERIVHGMLLAGLAEPALASLRIAGRISELRVRFLAPVHIGESVRISISEQPASAGAGRRARAIIAVDGGPIACLVDLFLAD